VGQRPAASAGPGRGLLLLASLGWVFAVLFAGTAGYLGLRYLEQRAESGRNWEDAQLARLESKAAHNRLEAVNIVEGKRTTDLQRASDVSILRVAGLAAPKARRRDASAVVVWNSALGEGVVEVERFPATEPTEDYQVWILDPKQPDPLTAGVFSVGGDGVARALLRCEQPLSEEAEFVIRRTRKGGLARPDGAIVASGRF
jgi:hypothetical protein